jgi:hypothetical protein
MIEQGFKKYHFFCKARDGRQNVKQLTNLFGTYCGAFLFRFRPKVYQSLFIEMRTEKNLFFSKLLFVLLV